MSGISGVKMIHIGARTTFPIVTAYEFEFLKTEEIVKALLKPCTIYIIAQRPMMYISDLSIDDGTLEFKIKDNSANAPLAVRIDPTDNGFSGPDEDLVLHLQFFNSNAQEREPYDDVAAIKFFRIDGEFVVWLTPQKILYEYMAGSLKAQVIGPIDKYIDYHVHYIGQAFSQDIWDRLTGHEKMQSVLTRERPVNTKAPTNSYEVSLILLGIEGFEEQNMMPYVPALLPPTVRPILHPVTVDGDGPKFWEPWLQPRSRQLTNEVEAMLINEFKPAYNDVKFDNYPEIKNGTRSVGYSTASLEIDQLLATLSTAYHTKKAVLP